MGVRVAALPRLPAAEATIRLDARAVVAWTVGFAPVVYLALRGGGYDPIVRSEVGLGVWWILLLGVVSRTFPLSGIGRLGWVCVGLLGAFAVWSGLATTWSGSTERSVDELSRLATYLGFLLLGLCLVDRGKIRQLVAGMATAFGLISALAVLSRLYPAAFPPNEVARFFPGSVRRLSYPLGYADGTGNLLAIGLPLLLATAARARTIAGQAAAAASMPVAILAIVLTASRGALITAVVGVVVYFALAPDRLPKAATAIVVAAGSAIAVDGLLNRAALRDGLSTPAAIAQRHQLLVLLILVCAGVALLQWGITLASRYAARPAALRISRRRAGYVTAAALLALVIAGVGADVPGRLANEWRSFKQTSSSGVASSNVYTRLGSVSGSHRYQYWAAALHAFEAKPLTGIGPGTFEFYWAQHGSIFEFVRNAHSLYLETLAETGLVGFVLIVSLFVAVLAAGVVRALRAPPLARASLAAATAALAAFYTAAGYDWMWQLPVAPAAALLLAGAILIYRDTNAVAASDPGAGIAPSRPSRYSRARGWAPPLGFAALSLLAVLAIAIPYRASSEIRASQTAMGTGDVRVALKDAAVAQGLEPYAATPRLQRALILEAAGDLSAARVAAAQATARGPVDWRGWLIRARIDAEAGDASAAVRDYLRAHLLNPRSPATAL